MKEKIAQEFRERTVESFLDLLILTMLAERPSMSADNLTDFLHQKFKVSLNLGLIYSHLFHLEQDGLIRKDYNENKKVYRTTQKGKERIHIAKKNMSTSQWVIDQTLGK